MANEVEYHFPVQAVRGEVGKTIILCMLSDHITNKIMLL